MKRIASALVALLMVATFMAGCTGSSDLQDRVDELESKLSDIESEFDDVLSRMRDLESEIDDFDYEDWKINVPEVVDAFDDLERAVSDVEYEF